MYQAPGLHVGVEGRIRLLETVSGRLLLSTECSGSQAGQSVHEGLLSTGWSPEQGCLPSLPWKRNEQQEGRTWQKESTYMT